MRVSLPAAALATLWKTNEGSPLHSARHAKASQHAGKCSSKRCTPPSHTRQPFRSPRRDWRVATTSGVCGWRHRRRGTGEWSDFGYVECEAKDSAAGG